VQALDRHRRVTAIPFQQPGYPERAGLTLAECEAAAWAISPDGSRYRGAEAINMTLAVALGTRLPLRLYRLPGIRRLQDAVYEWVARHRSRLPGDEPYCRQHPEQCGNRSTTAEEA
jgi:predicted DCC family thiol-disulfide oxidoreductase YuxK